MSIADKQSLMHDTEMRIALFLTGENVSKVMQVLSENMSAFEIERIGAGINDAESEELLQTYLNAKRLEGRSEKTIERYNYIIRKMYEELNTPISKISVFHLRNYLSKEKARGISDSTLDGIRQVLSAYFGWLQKECLIASDPTINLNPIKSVKKVRKPYTAMDIEKLKECCESKRDKAIIALLLSTGCRISEICALNRRDIDFANKEIVVLGKGNKERTVFIDEVTAMLLQRYLDEREDDYEALFIGKGSERLTPHGIRNKLHHIAEKAGVENTHPHRFRRTLATNLIDHGMPIQEVASILGHEKLDTTMKYVYLSKTNVKNSYNKYVG